MRVVPRISAAEADLAYAAAQCVVETHRRLAGFLREGQTLGVIDSFVAKTLDDLKCKSCFLGYRVTGHAPFPSHACLSVNECVVHGTAGYHTEPMKAGDVLKIDIGVFHRGWVGDAAWTYVFGPPSPLVKRLMDAGKESLAVGVRMLRAGSPYLDWAAAVQDCVEKKHGFYCVENWGGHGYGRTLHAPPHLLNHRPGPSNWPESRHLWQPGNLIAVEPMIAAGTRVTRQNPSPYNRKQTEWPVFAADGSLTVHYEHDVLITDSGPRVLTEGLEETKDVIV